WIGSRKVQGASNPATKMPHGRAPEPACRGSGFVVPSTSPESYVTSGICAVASPETPVDRCSRSRFLAHGIDQRAGAALAAPVVPGALLVPVGPVASPGVPGVPVAPFVP